MKFLAPLVILAMWGFTSQAQTESNAPFQIIYSFSPAAYGAKFPTGRLVEGDGQEFYGTTLGGGPFDRGGSVFKISKSGQFTVLKYFDQTNGYDPSGGLVRGMDGDFYGASSSFGTYSKGNLYKITSNGTFTVLHSFRFDSNGTSCHGPLTQTADGHFYGTTQDGGAYGSGTIFRYSTNGTFSTLYSFNGESGYGPRERLVPGRDGCLYSSTPFGAAGGGAVFRFATNGLMTPLVAFNETNGFRPRGDLIFGADGHLYGTTSAGGAFGKGTVFKLTTNGLLTTLHHFDGTNGKWPYGGVVQSRQGYLYGTTLYDGTNAGAYGTLFRITTNGAFTTLLRFDGTNGTHPYANMLQGSDGSIYAALGDATLTVGVNGGTILRFDEPPTITSIARTGIEATLAWPSFSNRTYQIEYKPSPSDTNWMMLAPSVPSGGNTTSFAVQTSHEPQRCYRVALVPSPIQ